MIGVAESGKTVALVEINAETDFVAKNERFKQFVEAYCRRFGRDKSSFSGCVSYSRKVLKRPSLQLINTGRQIIQAIGENIQIKRILTVAKRHPDRSIGVYSHLGGKIVTLVEIMGSGDEEALAKDIAMHVAAAAPEYLSPEKVPARNY